MSTLRRRRSLLLSIAGMVAGLLMLFPMRFGGFATFVVVQGDSMQPTYHSGDLLYAWRTDHFDVGDVAVYRIPAGEPGAGHQVVHRVIERSSDGRYLLQGDNRDEPDDARPASGDMVASPLVNLGPWATRLMFVVPFLLAAVVAVIVAWLIWPRDEEAEAEAPGPTAPSAA